MKTRILKLRNITEVCWSFRIEIESKKKRFVYCPLPHCCSSCSRLFPSPFLFQTSAFPSSVRMSLFPLSLLGIHHFHFFCTWTLRFSPWAHNDARKDTRRRKKMRKKGSTRMTLVEKRRGVKKEVRMKEVRERKCSLWDHLSFSWVSERVINRKSKWNCLDVHSLRSFEKGISPPLITSSC